MPKLKTQSRRILGVKIDDVGLEWAAAKAEEWLKGKNSKIFTLVTPNPEIVVQARDDCVLKRILNGSDLAIPDGTGLRLGGIKNTLAGVELVKALCRKAAAKGWKVGLYGGCSAGKALGELRKRYSGLAGWSRRAPSFEIKNQKLKIKGTNQKSKLDNEIALIGKKIDKSRTRIVFIGLGAPKQEYLIDALVKARPSASGPRGLNLILMGVGGSFDELAGKTKPAPNWVRRAGMKWLWRLIQEPWRTGRQLRLVKFVLRLLKNVE